MSHTIDVVRNTWPERTAVRVANWILRTFAPTNAKYAQGAIEYGLRSVAEDLREGFPYPPDWRPSDEA